MEPISICVPSHSQVIWHFKCALAKFPLHSLKHIWSLPMYSVSTSSLEEYIKLTEWGPLGNRIIRHNIFKQIVFSHKCFMSYWAGQNMDVIKGQPFMKRPFGMILVALLPSVKAKFVSNLEFGSRHLRDENEWFCPLLPVLKHPIGCSCH